MDDYSEFVPNVHFELIPIKSLVSNQDYQRNLSKCKQSSKMHTFSPANAHFFTANF